MSKQPQAPKGADPAPLNLPEEGAASLQLTGARDVKAFELHAAKLAAIPLDLVDFSPTNPRKVLPTKVQLEELGASIRSVGLLNPILVRPKGRRFELVHGECRVRAARLAKLEELPGRVADMDDRSVLEAQLEENLRRTDLHPLEEAHGYQELLDRHGYTADSLAARIGRSRGYVYARLKLCALGKGPALAAFEANELEASTALLIARVPAPLQADAFKLVKGRAYRDAARIVQAEFMLQLASAPFDTGDAELVPKAGACTACPKRTGNQRELFGDVRGADVCTDPACFKLKALAQHARLAKDLPPARVIAPSKAAKLFNGDRVTYGAPFVDVDQPDTLGELTGKYGRGPGKPLRALLGKKLPQDALLLAQDQEGRARWLLRKDAAVEALKVAGVARKELAARERSRSSAGDYQRDARRKAEKKRVEGRAMVEAVLERWDAEPASSRLAVALEVLAAYVFESAPAEVSRLVAKARGIEKKGQHPSLYRTAELLRWLKSQPLGEQQHERRRLALELALQAGAPHPYQTGAGESLERGIELLGVKPAKVRAAVAKARKAKKKKGAPKT